jgi:hypothetical protein
MALRIDTRRRAERPVSVGRHVLEVAGLDIKFSKNGNEMEQWRLKVVDDGIDKGKTIFHITMLDSFHERRDQFLDALDLPEQEELPESAIIGKRLVGVIEQEEYEGVLRARIKECYKLGQEGAAANASGNREEQTDTDDFPF